MWKMSFQALERGREWQPPGKAVAWPRRLLVAAPRHSWELALPGAILEKSLQPSENHRQHLDEFFLDHLCNTYYSIPADRHFDVLSPEPIDSPCLESRGRGTSETFIALILSPPLACMSLGKILNLFEPHCPYLQKKPVLLRSS